MLMPNGIKKVIISGLDLLHYENELKKSLNSGRNHQNRIQMQIKLNMGNKFQTQHAAELGIFSHVFLVLESRIYESGLCNLPLWLKEVMYGKQVSGVSLHGDLEAHCMKLLR